MTFFYKCIDCKRIVGFGKSGKGSIQLIKVHGSCCYDVKQEAKQINDWRLKQGLGKEKLKEKK